MDYALQESSNKFENILASVLKIPGVKIDRQKFLSEVLSKKIKDVNTVNLAIKTNPVQAGISVDKLDKIAKSLINKRTTDTTLISFATGIPGGLAMAATVPADTLQFFATAIKLSQELVYLYGYGDISAGNKLDEDIRRELTLYLGVMLGIEKSASMLRVMSTNISKQVVTRTSRRALSKTTFYAMVKKIGTIIGVKVTKEGFAKGVSKAVPVVGGIVAGGSSYMSMKYMGKRLSKVLSESIDYTDNDFERDLRNIESGIIEVNYY